jgi:hypothetical protein
LPRYIPFYLPPIAPLQRQSLSYQLSC